MKNRFINFSHHCPVVIFRLFLGGLFIYASLHKLQDPVAFSRIIYGYRILPLWAINIAAIVLPGVELVAGAFLLAGLFSRGAALVVCMSLIVFILGIGFNLARGLEFDCGCFSLARSKHGAAFDLLLRDLIFLALSIAVLRAKGYSFSVDRLLGRE